MMSDPIPFPVERRRHPRTHLQMTLQAIRLDPDGGEVLDSLRMIDISRGGIGACSERAFYPGQRIVLCLPLSKEHGRRNIFASIVRCKRSRDDEGYRIGLEFDSTPMSAWSGESQAAVVAA